MFRTRQVKIENCDSVSPSNSQSCDFSRCVRESLWLDSIEHPFINSDLLSLEKPKTEMEKISFDSLIELSTYISQKKKENPNGCTADGESENTLRARLLACQIIQKQFYHLIHDGSSNECKKIEIGNEDEISIDRWTLISIFSSCVCDDEPQKFKEFFKLLITAHPINCLFATPGSNSFSSDFPFGTLSEEQLSIIAEILEYYMKYYLDLALDPDPVYTHHLLLLALELESQISSYFSANFFMYWSVILQNYIKNKGQNFIGQQILLVDKLLKRFSAVGHDKEFVEALHIESLKLEITKFLRNRELEAATKGYNTLRELNFMNRENLIFKIQVGIELYHSSGAVSRKELYEYFQTFVSNFLNKGESVVELLKLSDDLYLWLDVLLLEWGSNLEKRVPGRSVTFDYLAGLSTRLEAFLTSFGIQSKEHEFMEYLDKIISLLKTISFWLRETESKHEATGKFLSQLIRLGEKLNQRNLHIQAIELFEIIPLTFSVAPPGLRTIYFYKIDSQIKILAPLESAVGTYQLMKYASEDEKDFFILLTKLKIVMYQYYCKSEEDRPSFSEIFAEEFSFSLQELFSLESMDIHIFRMFCCDYLDKSKIFKKFCFGGILGRFLFEIISLIEGRNCPTETEGVALKFRISLGILQLIAAALQEEMLVWSSLKTETKKHVTSERNMIEFFLKAYCKTWDILFEIHSESLQKCHKIRVSEFSSLMEELFDSIQIIMRVFWNTFLLLQQSKFEVDSAIHFLRLYIQLQSTTLIFKHLRLETAEIFKKLMDFRMNTAFEIIEDHYNNSLKGELTDACEKVIRYACWVLEDSKNQAQISKLLIEEIFLTLQIIEERISLRLEAQQLSFHLRSTYFGVMGLYSPSTMKNYLEKIVHTFQANPEFLLILAKTASEYNQFQTALFAWNSYSVYAFVNDKLKELPGSAYLLALELVSDSTKKIKLLSHIISKIALFLKETSFEEAQETGILLSIRLGLIYRQLLENKNQDSAQKQLIEVVLKLYTKLLDVLPENFDCLLESEYGIMDPECKYYEQLFEAP